MRINTTVIWFTYGIVGLVLQACATNLKDQEGYIKEAVVINISASKKLNTYNRQSHTVILALYELSNPNIFNQLLEDTDGVAKLLEGKSFDSSVLSRRRIVVQPGESRQLLMDRVEGARYLGAVAGFYSMQGATNFSRLYPITMESKPPLFWRRDKDPRVHINLQLGSDGFLRHGKQP